MQPDLSHGHDESCIVRYRSALLVNGSHQITLLTETSQRDAPLCQHLLELSDWHRSELFSARSHKRQSLLLGLLRFAKLCVNRALKCRLRWVPTANSCNLSEQPELRLASGNHIASCAARCCNLLDVQTLGPLQTLRTRQESIVHERIAPVHNLALAVHNKRMRYARHASALHQCTGLAIWIHCHSVAHFVAFTLHKALQACIVFN